MQKLDGIWSLVNASAETQISMAVPGDAISALHAAGAIPDPYFGRNEYDLRAIADQDWTLSRSFDVTDTDQDLILSDLDTIADVLVNGQVVLEARNAFRRYRVNLAKVLRAGHNTIDIRFHSNTKAADDIQAQQPRPIPYQTGNCAIPNGNMLRKVQCDFGWDWNIALAPFGLYGDVALEPRQALRIEDVITAQTHSKDGVSLTIDLCYASRLAQTLPIRAEVAGQSVQFDAFIHPGKGRQRIAIDIPAPAKWWPAGHGAQQLHDLVLAIGDVTAKRRIGFCDIELVSQPDDAGRSFGFRVNGRDIFARGANWIPADALAGRITQEKTRDLLQSAVDANMNMIRVWGGGRYEASWFYQLCDELGLMVWQDFMFACNLYPADAAFLDEVAAEVRDQVQRLNHHPSIALWCGDNELIGALTWFEESVKDRDYYLVAYDRLNRTIESALKQTQPSANWWPSSPSPGPLSFGDAWHDDTSGDMHFWSVWHEGRDFEHYRDVKPRFCSEFGFQSFPSMDVIERFTTPEDRNISTPVMESHQKNAGGNARITETMFRYFRFPNTFEDFVYLSQIQQGLAIKTAVTAWRSLKPHCMGTLYWQLNDTWPVASWSGLDHGGGWKHLHHMARGFFQPVTVTACPETETGAIRISGVNDTPDKVDVAVTLTALSADGRATELGAVSATITPDTAALITAVQPQDGDVLYWEWTASDGTSGRDHLRLRPYKEMALRAPGITCDVARNGDIWTVTVTATALALYVAISADCPGRFDQNAILIRPGAPQTFAFTPKAADAAPRFTVQDLYSATHTSDT